MRKAIFSFCLLSVMLVSRVYGGRGCEVEGFSAFERAGLENVEGLPVQVMEKCAFVRFRNTDRRNRYATDYNVTAFFKDGGSRTRPINGDKDRLQKISPGAEYTTSLCFGADRSPIVRLDCGL